MTTVPSEVTAYFESISPTLTNQLGLQERIVAILRLLQYDSDASRTETAVALRTIQADLARLAQSMTAVRTPPRLAAAGGTLVQAVQQAGSATAELREALMGEPAARVERAGRALRFAREAESSTRAAADAITAVLGAAIVVAGIPIIGPIIAAVLAAIAAIIVLIGTILAKAKEEEAEEKEKQDSTGEPARKERDDG